MTALAVLYLVGVAAGLTIRCRLPGRTTTAVDLVAAIYVAAWPAVMAVSAYNIIRSET